MANLPITRKEMESKYWAAFAKHLKDTGKESDVEWSMLNAYKDPNHGSVEEIVRFEGGDPTKPLTFWETKIGNTYIVIYNYELLKNPDGSLCTRKFRVATRKDPALDRMRPVGICPDYYQKGMWSWPYMGNFMEPGDCVFYEKID
jgi:hypothetical protein